MREAEARLSGNLGNMDMISVAGRNRAERSAMWLMLKVRERHRQREVLLYVCSLTLMLVVLLARWVSECAGQVGGPS